ncbi:hypothetical protein [Bradyrhizobium commune]|uniref:Transcription factor zinc-finger domain-containing protein n=1 Tax=Bradyrhizobium commune TaxID=83627 RepID=A0A7S9D471_9BRAD|nr:hypothetical protein [Bradyrhizobium commune]QPF90902.1 hypothetical protein IC761_31270 [Bradyrhizobium commune]
MSIIDIEDAPRPRIYARNVLSRCPECDSDLAVLRVISGRAGCEYWTMRCTDCGGIHLDILEPRVTAEDDGPLPAA